MDIPNQELLLKRYIQDSKIHIMGKYVFNNNGGIDVNGDVILRLDKITGKTFNIIPFKFNKVLNGFFQATNNRLVSLEGSPKYVDSTYCAKFNMLKNLKGCPEYVGGGFRCTHNQLTTFDYFPDEVGGSLYCYENRNLPYSELFKIVDKVKGNIHYTSLTVPEDKDQIRRDRDKYHALQHDELGNLDI